MLQKPWILVADGIMINLNFIIKFIRKSDTAEGIIFFHSSAGTAASQRVNYADAGAADAKFAEIQAILEAGAVFQDVSA